MNVAWAIQPEICAAATGWLRNIAGVFGSREAAKRGAVPRRFSSHGLTRIFTDNRRDNRADLLSVFHGLPSEAGTPLLRLDMDMHGCVARDLILCGKRSAVESAGHHMLDSTSHSADDDDCWWTITFGQAAAEHIRFNSDSPTLDFVFAAGGVAEVGFEVFDVAAKYRFNFEGCQKCGVWQQ